jgi:exosortase family protein XrtF
MLKQYRHALIFLAKYIVLYVLMNSIYAWYIESYRPNADPVTIVVTKHSAFIISLFDNEVKAEEIRALANVPIMKGSETVIEVYEGCNSINVMIVFVAFIFAFHGHWKILLPFLTMGLAIIYLINLLRIIALYIVALEFPQALYFFHKFLFTGVIYLIVFGLWYWWTLKVKEWQVRYG